MKLETTIKRSKIMKSIKGSDTGIEVRLRKALWHKGIRYRKNFKVFDCHPDIVITKYKIAVFCDGNFWHGKELQKRPIKHNSSYWNEKIRRNVERDLENTIELRDNGWIVLRFWEDDIQNNLPNCVDDVLRYISIEKYGDKLKSFDVQRFNKNIIDPVKLIFDKTVYQADWKETISNEIFRQRDKSNNNDIGYFHQRIFQYIDKCHVPDNGTEGGWDVIYKNPEGIILPDGSCVHTVYVEMKNKHNTMNSSAAGKTFIKMQNQLLKDDDCACFLVEAIAKKSQNIKWETTVDGQRVGHKLIRRVSIDKFYELVTGQENAFFKLCMVLPTVIQKVVDNNGNNLVPHDTVYDELRLAASNVEDKDMIMEIAIFMLGFSTYNGFSKLAEK